MKQYSVFHFGKGWEGGRQQGGIHLIQAAAGDSLQFGGAGGNVRLHPGSRWGRGGWGSRGGWGGRGGWGEFGSQGGEGLLHRRQGRGRGREGQIQILQPNLWAEGRRPRGEGLPSSGGGLGYRGEGLEGTLQKIPKPATGLGPSLGRQPLPLEGLQGRQAATVHPAFGQAARLGGILALDCLQEDQAIIRPWGNGPAPTAGGDGLGTGG